MAAAEMTETFVAGDGSLLKTTGQAMKSASYTVTIATQNDWVIFDDFSEVKGVYAEIVATGVLNPATIDGSTKNKVTFTSATTGAIRVLVWGY